MGPHIIIYDLQIVLETLCLLSCVSIVISFHFVVIGYGGATQWAPWLILEIFITIGHTFYT